MAKTVKKVVKVKDSKEPVAKVLKKEVVKSVAVEVEKTKPVEVKKVVKEKKAAIKAEPKKVEEKVVEAKKEAKKIASKPEPKKIAAKKEPKKIAAKKEPSKIASKPEPLKIVETKATEVVKEEVKVEPKAKVVAKVKKTAKVEKVVKPTTKETKKKPTTDAKAPLSKEKQAHYEALSLEECISLVQAMNVQYAYDDYYNLLLDEANLSQLEKNIIEGNNIKELKLSYKENGYDEDLIIVTLQKVADTMDVKAVEYKELKKRINAALKYKMSDDSEENAAQYLNEFKLSEKLLMIAQRKDLVTVVDEGQLIDADVQAYFAHFFDFAYALLPQWQYSDVKFYEDFAYAVLSQFSDLYETNQLRVQIDVADLYILHGDYAHGDEMYGYILRDNQIKDYIYYRYASVYKEIDYNKAKSIAYSSLQYVDDRFTYYTKIMEIINN